MIPHLSYTLDWALINQLIRQKKNTVICQQNITYALLFYTLPVINKSCQESVPGPGVVSGIEKLYYLHFHTSLLHIYRYCWCL